MYKKLRRTAAAFLAAALLMQSAAAGTAEQIDHISEPQTQVQLETQMPAMAEPQDVTETQMQGAPEMQQALADLSQNPVDSASASQDAAGTELPAGEPQTQGTPEAQTQGASELQTQGISEPQTQSISEPQTQGATETKPGQDAADAAQDTEGSSETAQTQQASADFSQNPSDPASPSQDAAGMEQPPAGEPQTQQKETEDQGTEQKKAEDQETEQGDTEEQETEQEETERAQRVNDGSRLEAQDLVDRLETALPYLFVAETVETPDGDFWENEAGETGPLAGQRILTGSEGGACVSGLSSFSTELANAVTSTDVAVINLYADEDGGLNTAQLDEAFEDQVIDVTLQYYVINVIADYADQPLSFADFDMTLSGAPVSYTDASQPGDILYNFAAWDGDGFTGYTGELTLSDGDGLQGTFLAPEADVLLQSDLAGAVYASNVTANGGAENLLSIAFAQRRPSAAGPDAMDGAQDGMQNGTSSEMQNGMPNGVQSDTSSEMQNEMQDSASNEAQNGMQSGSSSETQSEMSSETQSESSEEIQSEPGDYETELIGESEIVGEVDAAGDGQNGDESGADDFPILDEAEVRDESLADRTERKDELPADGAETKDELPADETEPEDGPFAEETETETDGTQISLMLQNNRMPIIRLTETAEFTVTLTEDGAAPSEGSTMTVSAAADIADEEGKIIYAAGTEVPDAVKSGAEAGSYTVALAYSGEYCLNVAVPEGYYAVPPRYFAVDEEGAIAFSGASGWESGSGELTIAMVKDASELPEGTVLFEVKASEEPGTGTPGASMSGAEFYIKNDAGDIVYFIQYPGSPVVLSGFADGTYTVVQTKAAPGYQVAADLSFTLADEGSTVTVENKPVAEKTEAGTIQVSAQVFFRNVPLYAVENAAEKYYVALFSADPFSAEPSTAGTAVRVSDVQELTFRQDQHIGDAISFDGLPLKTSGESPADAVYYLALTDQTGMPIAPDAVSDVYKYTYQWQITKGDGAGGASSAGPVTFTEVGQTAEAALQIVYQDDSYPKGSFYYLTTFELTKKVVDSAGNDVNSSDTFYANLYADATHTVPLTAESISFSMNGNSTATQSVTLKMTASPATCYIAETDRDGNVPDSSSLLYTVSYVMPPETALTDGQFTVNCGVRPQITIQNQLKESGSSGGGGGAPAGVRIRVTDANGNYVPGVTLVIKDSAGNLVATVVTGESDIVLYTLAAGDYYLSVSSVSAEYAPAADVPFTVNEDGSITLADGTSGSDGIKITLEEKDDGQTAGYALTVRKQIYVDGQQVYARDPQTFYAALFKDADYREKVSNVQSITVSGLEGSTVFENLTSGVTYYIAETDANGIPLKSGSPEWTVDGTDGGAVTMTSDREAVLRNNYAKLPKGCRYTGTLTITKQVTSASGRAKNVTETFYAGIFRKADFSDKPTVISLNLNHASSAQAGRRILLSDKAGVTYYIRETDQNGNPVNGSRTFGYSVSIDQPKVTIVPGTAAAISITNQSLGKDALLAGDETEETEETEMTETEDAEPSKVSLYLTKRVYAGTMQQAVNETFYVGLFKDEDCTQLYARPIALNLDGKSELTLRLSLNLGKTEETTVYIAEVDRDGKMIQNEQEFGYEIRLINAKASFTKYRKAIQTILLNSVYGSATDDDWQSILDDGFDDLDEGWLGDDWTVSENGGIGGGTSAKTADDTPVVPYLVLMSAALALFAVQLRRKIRSY